MTLSLHAIKVTDVGLAHFSDCQQLKSLGLRSCILKNQHLHHFKNCRNLTYLDLAATELDVAELQHFQDRAQLAHLDIGGVRTTPADVEFLTNFKQLAWLNLGRTTTTDEGVAMLHNCRSLKFVSLKQNKISQSAIDALRNACRSAASSGMATWSNRAIDAFIENRTLIRDVNIQYSVVPKTPGPNLAPPLPACWQDGKFDKLTRARATCALLPTACGGRTNGGRAVTRISLLNCFTRETSSRGSRFPREPQFCELLIFNHQCSILNELQ